jgi:hypothetical protein
MKKDTDLSPLLAAITFIPLENNMGQECAVHGFIHTDNGRPYCEKCYPYENHYYRKEHGDMLKDYRK